MISAGSRRLWTLEVLLVLGLSLGRSAVYSVLSIIDKLTRPEPLAQQTTTMNASATPERPWLDLSYQFVGIFFGLMPVLLVLYLLTRDPGPPEDPHRRHEHDVRATRLLGFDLIRPGTDGLRGLVLALAIGVPGLGLYLGARALGVNTAVSAGNLAENWWTVPVYVGWAAMNGVLEEVVMVGYLFRRLIQLPLTTSRWLPLAVVALSALIRGSYHLYQGFGGFVGNVLMGLIFGALYLRWGRVMPLVIAHTLLDVGAFVGYSLLAPHLAWLR